MIYYICYMYLGEADNPGHWAQYIRTSEALAMDVYLKWAKLPATEVTGFGVTKIELDPVTGLSTTHVVAHHVNPVPKKVIYNQVKGLKPKNTPKFKEEEVQHGGFGLPPAADEAEPNWVAIHNAFAEF